MAREAGGSLGKCASIEMWIRENFTNTSVVNILNTIDVTRANKNHNKTLFEYPLCSRHCFKLFT